MAIYHRTYNNFTPRVGATNDNFAFAKPLSECYHRMWVIKRCLRAGLAGALAGVLLLLVLS